jgi:hypothetical protein
LPHLVLVEPGLVPRGPQDFRVPIDNISDAGQLGKRRGALGRADEEPIVRAIRRIMPHQQPARDQTRLASGDRQAGPEIARARASRRRRAQRRQPGAVKNVLQAGVRAQLPHPPADHQREPQVRTDADDKARVLALQARAEPPVIPKRAGRAEPPHRHRGIQRPGGHEPPDLRFGPVGDIVGHASGAAAVEVVRPRAGKIELAIDDERRPPSHIGQIKTGLTILHPPAAFRILPIHAHRVSALLDKLPFVEDQHCLGIGRHIDDELAEVVAHLVRVPSGGGQQSLHAVRVPLAAAGS